MELIEKSLGIFVGFLFTLGVTSWERKARKKPIPKESMMFAFAIIIATYFIPSKFELFLRFSAYFGIGWMLYVFGLYAIYFIMIWTTNFVPITSLKSFRENIPARMDATIDVFRQLMYLVVILFILYFTGHDIMVKIISILNT